MESTHNVPGHRGHGQSPFFYYNPEPGHFSPHPSAGHEGTQMHPFHHQAYQAGMMAHGQPQMFYARPPSSGSSIYLPPKTLMALQPHNTPLASPRPMYQRPTFPYHNEGQQLTLNTKCGTPDLWLSPSTPPLSVSASTVSSPPSACGVLPTPVCHDRLPLDNLQGVKEGCEGEVQTEILAGGDWARCGSPPMTPGTFPCNAILLSEKCRTLILLEVFDRMGGRKQEEEPRLIYRLQFSLTHLR